MNTAVDEMRRVAGLLACVNPDCARSFWVKMLMAVKSELGEAGRTIAEEWSAKGDKYDKAGFDSTWKSIKEGGNVTIATLVYEAKKNGHTCDSSNRPTPLTLEGISQREATLNGQYARARVLVQEQATRRQEAAVKAATIMNDATGAPADHPYLKSKGIHSHGARIYHGILTINGTPCDGMLMLPMYLNQKISSLQFIAEDGKKLFLPGGEKGGYPIGKLEPGKLCCICEGFATGATIHKATGYPVIVAFDAGNLCKMAEAFRAKNPDIKIILCADDDYLTSGNPGMTKAKEAARAVGGLLALPDFGEDRPEGHTDFNDMAGVAGLNAVKLAIDAAVPVLDHAGSDISVLNSAGDTNTAPETQKTIAEPTDADIERLALLSELQYARKRTKQAKAWGLNVGMLDKLVKNARSSKKESSQLPFKEVDPWPDPIDPAQLLDQVAGTIKRFIVLDDEQAHAAALWIAQTWFIDVVEYAPLALINAPEKACGKTQLLNVIERMTYRPLSASNASASALFRAVEKWKPTILIDEADTFFRDNTELHGMVNAGYKLGSSWLRSEPVGDSWEARSFPVFSAKALAGIQLEKHLPDATMSRGIIFNLRRKAAHESVDRPRHAEPWLFSDISAKLARFAQDYSGQVRDARPDIPEKLSDRDQDNWESMLAIADCAGGEWPDKARAAAKNLSGAGDKPVSTGNELLKDIRQVFEIKKVEKISTADLITALCEDEEAPWSTFNWGKPISPRQLAKQLKAYGIAPEQMRMNSYGNGVRGFELSRFDDAFERYLKTPTDTPPNYPLHVTKPQEANKHGGLSVTDRKSCNVTEILSVTKEPNKHGACNAVTDKTPILGRGEEGIYDEVEL